MFYWLSLQIKIVKYIFIIGIISIELSKSMYMLIMVDLYEFFYSIETKSKSL